MTNEFGVRLRLSRISLDRPLGGFSVLLLLTASDDFHYASPVSKCACHSGPALVEKGHRVAAFVA
jgi:hypothetical protein